MRSPKLDNVKGDIVHLFPALWLVDENCKIGELEGGKKKNTCLGVPCPTNHSPLLKGLQWHLRGNLMAVIPESLPL